MFMLHDYLNLRLLCIHLNSRDLTHTSSVFGVHEVCRPLDVMRGVFVLTLRELH